MFTIVCMSCLQQFEETTADVDLLSDGKAQCGAEARSLPVTHI